MKGVLKIKILKKYIPILFTAFVFLFVNINYVNAQEYEFVLEENSKVFSGYKQVRIGYTKNGDVISDTNKVVYTFEEDLPTNIKYGDVYYFSSDSNVIPINNTIEITDRQITVYYNGNISYLEATGSGISQLKNLNVNAKYYKLIEPYLSNIRNLNYDINNNEVLFSYDLPDDINFSHLELHQDGLLLADNITTDIFEVYNLEYDTKYNFTFYAVDKDGLKSNGISREIALPSDPNLIPSNNIFGLTHSVSDTTVSFNYSLPLDNNFSHLKIYRNNELINDNYQLAEFIDTGLDPETEYNYRFVSVNKMDISNVGYAITIKTMEENDDVPPAIPTGLESTNMNSGIVLSWNTNNESDLQGYYVYMNGVKLNNKPISNSIYNITNLENGIEYSLTVSAVDTFGNESEQSTSVIGVPDVDSLPIFKLDTQLSSIGSSVENWFSEIWLIVAFATAIPLSFAIAGRVKGLFIA